MKCPYCKHELTAEDRKRICKGDDAKRLGSIGGKAKFKNMTPEQIKEYQKQVAIKGWETRRKRQADKNPEHPAS